MTDMLSNGAPVQFGLFDWIEWDERSPSDIFEQRLKMLEYADRAGFFCYHLAEHHITPLSLAPSPGIFLSAAAQRTKRLRFGPLVYLLPFYNPLRLIHEICMIDHLSKGRLELGVGRGIVPMEAEKYNLKVEELWSIFNESLDILLTAFTHDTLNYEGKYYNYKDVQLWIHPFQKPYPPLWYASNNIETVPWMAQHGFNTADVFDTATVTKAHFDLYRQHWQEHRDDPNRLNGHVETPKLGLVRHLYVAPTDQQAEKECREAFATWYHNISFLFTKAGIALPIDISNFDELVGKEVVIVGTPQRVREQVKRAIEESGINYFCPIFAFGDLTHEQVMGSMRLFVQKVMPTFVSGPK